MKIIFKVAMFALLLNLSAATILFSVPELGDEYTSVITPIASQTQGQTEFIEGLGGNVTLPSTSADSSNIKDILLDSIFIGKIIKFVKGVYTLFYGFPQIVYNSLLIFTPTEDSTAYLTFLAALKGILITIVSIGYGLGIFFLWTGKRLND